MGAINRAIHERASAGALFVRVNRHKVADGVYVKYVQTDRLLALSRVARGTLSLQIVLQHFSHRGNAPIVVARRETRSVRSYLWFLQRLFALLVLLYDLLDELQQRAVDGIAAVNDGPRGIVGAPPIGQCLTELFFELIIQGCLVIRRAGHVAVGLIRRRGRGGQQSLRYSIRRGDLNERETSD